MDFTECRATINGTTGPIDSPSWQSDSMFLVSTTDFSIVLAAPKLATNGTSMVVQKPPPWNSTLTIAASPSSVRLPTPFVLSGLLTPGDNDPSDLIVVQVMKPGSARWSYSSNRVVYAAAGSGAASWQYKYTLKAGMAKGTYQFRAVYAVDDWYAGYTSTTVKVVAK